MKKLMIAAAIVCAAVVSQAAAVSWYTAGHDGVWDPSAEDYGWLNGGQAYLVLVTDTDNFSVTTDGSKLSLVGGDIVHSVEFADGEAIGNWQDTGSLVKGNTYLFAMIGTTDGVEGNVLPTTGFYGVDNKDGDFYSITWNGDTSVAFANEDGFAVNNPIQAVPEPTSGLLLLLGVAGLALRRRRA